MSQRKGTHPGRELVVCGGFIEILNVWSSDASWESLQGLSSDHEEADTQIVLHARELAVRGYQQANLLCRDPDVLVLLLPHRKDLCLRYIPNKEIHFSPQDLIARGEEEVAASLPYYHWLWYNQPVLRVSVRNQPWKSLTVYWSLSNIKAYILHQRKVSWPTLKHLSASCTTIGQTE